MKGKKLMAMLAGMILTFSIAACGNSESAGNSAPKNTETAKVSAQTEAGAGEATGVPADTAESGTDGEKETKGENGTDENMSYNVTWEDTADITVLWPSMGPIPNGTQTVEDAINEITEEEINTHVTLKLVEVGNYDQQVSLMISSNEALDLMITLPGGSSAMGTMLNQKQLTDLTELMPEYAPKAMAEIGELIKGTQKDGRIMALPAYKGFVSGEYINMRTDVLEDLGLLDKALNMKSFTEFEEILEAVKNSEKWSYLAGITATDGHGAVLPDFTKVIYSDNFSDCKFIENLGNGAVVRNDGSNTVVNDFSTDEIYGNYEIVKRWYDKGYVYKDSPTTQEMGTALIKSNVAFSHIAEIEIGGEASQDTNCGMDMTSVLITTKPVATSSLTKFTWVVPTTCKEPEAAMTFYEMLFNDPRIANLFAWGIEGVDYEVGDDGVAHYIEGNDNPAYHTVAFLNANKFIVHPWTGDDPDINSIQKKYMDEAEYSPYLGFNVSYDAISNEVSSVSSVYTEFQAQIISGVATEDTYQDFLDKLGVSGMDKIIAHYQEQLNSWLEAN